LKGSSFARLRRDRESKERLDRYEEHNGREIKTIEIHYVRRAS
jgi:hypothetical protein